MDRTLDENARDAHGFGARTRRVALNALRLALAVLALFAVSALMAAGTPQAPGTQPVETGVAEDAEQQPAAGADAAEEPLEPPFIADDIRIEGLMPAFYVVPDARRATGLPCHS